jgi:predicted ATP-grasp superfamily ATP-dependent carboligase
LSALPPAILLGGSHSALSVARSLGRRGIAVYAVNQPDSAVLGSRYVHPEPIAAGVPFPSGALERLRSLAVRCPRDSVLLAASDEGIEVLLENREELAERFRLDLCNPQAQRRMLDKRLTYEAAREAGVAAPRFWVVSSREDLERLAGELVFPLLVKPRLSHLFQRHFRSKFLEAREPSELAEALAVVERAGVSAVLMEKIPGPDHELCSYYTYLDERGDPLCHFTKRIIRRQPPNMGLASFHVTDHVEGIQEPALRLFRHVGLRGLANVEFKRDARDGTLKLIECNARFTAANRLVDRAGLDLAWLVYARSVGLPLPPVDAFRDGMRLWSPGRDLLAFLALRRRGELGLGGWLRSIAHPTIFPVFSWSDPEPSAGDALRRARNLFSRLRARALRGARRRTPAVSSASSADSSA